LRNRRLSSNRVTREQKTNEPSSEQFSADIKANGVLVVDGQSATLTVRKKTKDASGTSTSTTTQEFKLEGGESLVSR